jgi:uncharacterized damage-inducible protein DinB
MKIAARNSRRYAGCMMPAAPSDLSAIFLSFSREKLLAQYWPRLRSCVESLSDDQVWWRPNSASNSIGNLLLHLNGNVTQWLIASFLHIDDRRDRPSEFSRTEGIAAAALLDLLAATMARADEVLRGLSEADLKARLQIQGYDVTGLEAVYQVVEHFGLHYGQVAYITKLLRDTDLAFYRELNATGHAPSSVSSRP